MADSVQGTWGIGGLKLPDFGLTEYLSGGNAATWANNPAVYQAAGTTQQDYSNTVAQNAQYALSQQGKAVNPYAPYKNTTTNTNATTGGTPPPAPSGIRTNDDAIRAGFTGLNDYNDQMARRNQGGGDPYAQLRNDISGNWDSYLGSLDSMINELPAQQTNLNNMANSQYTQGTNDLNAQKTLNMTDLGTQRRKNDELQAKNLGELSDNLRNQYQAGSIMLGTRGVSSPSAQRMYSYALTKEGNKSRGNVLSQSRSIESDIADRESKLNTIVTQESQKLASARDQKIMEAANWLMQAQQQLKMQKANGQLSKGQDLQSLSKSLLDQATQKANYFQQQYDSQRSALQNWAMSNASNISQLRANMNEVGQYSTPNYGFQALQGTPSYDSQGNLYAPLGLGMSSTEDWKKKLLG